MKIFYFDMSIDIRTDDYYFQGTFEQWRLVHLVIASAMFFGTCFFGYFGNSEVEPWNSQCKKTDDSDGENEGAPNH